jgi:chorismate mutase
VISDTKMPSRDEVIEKLERWRDQIDALDVRLVALLNERTRVVEEIGRLKQSAALPVYEPKREDQVYRNISLNNGGPLDDGALKRIFERIIDEMRTVQKERMVAKDSTAC